MALRAGYYGVKRRIKDKIEEIAGAWDQTVASLYPRSEQAFTGVLNFFDKTATIPWNPNVTVTQLNNGFTVDLSASQTYSGSKTPISLIPGKKYKLLFEVKASNSSAARFAIRDSANIVKYSKAFGTTLGKYELDFTYDTGYYVTLFVSFTTAGTGSVTVDDVMIISSDESVDSFVPYAMTNQEITTAIKTDESTLSDHKTTINGIISAATGAADFAAFKTAMEALTPLTRSLSTPDTRSTEPLETIPEESEIEEQPVKKTTRKKSTAKADTKEEV